VLHRCVGMILAGWFGFVGAWLLVFGPLYQGALELLEEDIHREDSAGLFEGLTPPAPPSAWWWLLPPAMLVLRQRRRAEFHELVLSRMTVEQRSSRAGFLHKATGWFIVAAGASCLAVDETWSVSVELGWPAWLFALCLLGMFAVVVVATERGVARMQRTSIAKASPSS
jgi:hypothetical protein